MKKKSNRGFSLIELLVVMGIFVILTAVVLARQNRFSSDILLTDMAYQVAISIRQAQVYGLGVRGANQEFNTGYGVHFGGPLPVTSYNFFPDLDRSGDSSNDAGVAELSGAGATPYTLVKGKIANVCAYGDTGQVCLGGGDSESSYLEVTYDRPDPAAIISDDATNRNYDRLVVTLTSLLNDRFKCVTAYQTGQVAVSVPTGSGLNPCQ